MANSGLKRAILYLSLGAFLSFGAVPCWPQNAPSMTADPEVLVSSPAQPSQIPSVEAQERTQDPQVIQGQQLAQTQGPTQNQEPTLVNIKAVDAPAFLTQNGKSGIASVQRFGQGIIIDPQGVIATSKHIIENAQHVYVMLSSGPIFEATVLRSSEADLCLLKINAPFPLVAVSLANPSQIQIGNHVTAMANANLNLQRQRTGQVVDIFRGTASDMVEILEMNVVLNPGDSGGPIFNGQGSLLGLIMGKKISDPSRSYAVAVSRILKEYSAYKRSALS